MTTDQALSAARIAADLLLALVPHPESAKAMLDDAAVRRANAIADASERIKFGGG